MIKSIAWTKLVLEIGGDRQVITGLSLAKRTYFIELQTFIGGIVEQFPDVSIGSLYDLEPDFAWAIGESVRLFGLSPDDLSAGMVNQLLFAFEGGPGALWQLEFPDRGEVKGRLLNPEVDPYHAAIAAAWSYSPDKSLAEICEGLEAMPWNDYSGVLAERHRIEVANSPELQQKERDREQREALKTQIESMDFSTFFMGLDAGNPVGV